MKLCPKTNQPEQDIVYTPEYLAESIVNHFNPSGKLLEPCKGDGAFLKYMPTADWCEIQEGKDFLLHDTYFYDWIITNPPWSKIREFLNKSISLSTKNIVFLCNINALTTKARLRSIYHRGYAIKEFYCVDTPLPTFNWPQTGFQLAAIHIKQGYKGPTTWSNIIP